MLLPIAAILAGLALLVWSSDRFVEGSSALAFNLGVSPLVIGLTIVGFGTSAPEMLVAIFAATEGNPSLAIGNAIGSNIANIALILGVTALIMPMVVHSRILRLEIPVLVGISIFALLLLIDNYLSTLDGALLLVTLLAILTWLVRDAIGSKKRDVLATEMYDEVPQRMALKTALFWFTVGLIVLLASARLLVWGAVAIAQTMGVSDLVIGLTIVAIGTSLPELAASITSTLRNEPDLAIGNVIGSNMFNLLAVLAIPGLISPTTLPAQVLTRDYPVMLGLTVALFVMAFHFRSDRRRINRLEGGLLLTAFLGYQGLLFYTAAN
jgi:cation:H+ antiporter